MVKQMLIFFAFEQKWLDTKVPTIYQNEWKLKINWGVSIDHLFINKAKVWIFFVSKHDFVPTVIQQEHVSIHYIASKFV